jgi:anti-sigma B factor antagonist
MRHAYALEVCEPQPGEVRLRVSGEIDMESAPSLLDSILCVALSCEPGVRIVVDLDEVEFIDSSGFAALIEAQRRVTGQEQQFAVDRVHEPVRRLMAITGIDGYLGVQGPGEQSSAS